MDPALAVMILLVVVIIAALAIYLLATILELRKITAGLDVVIGGVGEIVAKSAPVNGVLDAINKNLVTGRDLLENLLLKKAGEDSAGLVESVFPGEGANFLRRVGRSGKVINVGTVYTRGVAILASLGRGAPIGAAHAKGPAVRDPQYATTAASMLYPRPGGALARPKSPVVGSGYGPKGGPTQYVPTTSPGQRPGRETEPEPETGGGGGAPDMPTGGGGAPPPSGRIEVREPDAQPAVAAPARLEGRGRRPWEKEAGGAAAASAPAPEQAAPAEQAPPPPPPPEPEPEPEPEPAPPPAPPAAGGAEPAEPGRLNVRGSRPWER